MKFTKMHGIGNDYIYFNCFDLTIEQMDELAIMVSDRHFGIGSDGAIFICPSDKADAEMRLYNADGSYAEMCGNGIRCVAKYIYDNAMVDSTTLRIESGGKVKEIKLNVKKEEPNPLTGKLFGKRSDGMVVESATVDMGEPILIPALIPVDVPEADRISDNNKGYTEIVTPSGVKTEAIISHPIEVDGVKYEMTCVSMGNPHAVVFVDNVKEFPLESIGRKFEFHEYFPKRVNTEFVRVIDRTHVEMRVSERGSGETLACGTGATATVVACILNGLTDDEVTVHLLGGDLKIKWDKETNHAFMTGGAAFICEGDI